MIKKLISPRITLVADRNRVELLPCLAVTADYVQRHANGREVSEWVIEVGWLFWVFRIIAWRVVDDIFAVNEKGVADTSDAITAVNEFKPEGDWVQLAPYGRFDNVVGLQVFGEPEATDVVNEFQSLLSTPARLLGLPWYIGHPDHEPLKQRYKDTRAYGRIKELATRADGLYGRVKFSTDGKKLIEDEAFHGHSVNWAMKRGPDNKWHPFRLKSVGWTNEPQIPVAPITAANEQQEQLMRNQLIKLLGLAETATDEEIIAAITALKDKPAAPTPDEVAANEVQLRTITAERDAEKANVINLTAQLGAEKTLRTNAETTAANERQRSRDLLIERGVREGKILVAEQPQWKTKFDAHFIDAANELQATKPKLNTQSKVTGLGMRNANLSTDRGQQIQDAVNERRAKFPHEAYDQTFAAVKREKPELFTNATHSA